MDDEERSADTAVTCDSTAALREAHDDWDSTFDAVTDLITLQDLDFNVVFANASARATLGVPPTPVKCFELFHGTAAPPAHCPGRDALQTGKPCALEAFEPHLGRYFEIRALPRTDRQGRVTGLIHVARDVTDRRKAADALRGSEERNRDLLDNLPLGVYRNTPGREGRFIFANPFIARMFGYDSTDEFLSVPVHDLYQDGVERRALSEELLEAGSVEKYEVRLRKKDGSTLWAALTARAVAAPEGGVAYFDGFVEDITARKMSEQEREKLEKQLQQAQKMESVGRLAGGVAHDFNNMLAVILGHADLALDTLTPGDPLHNDLSAIVNAATRSADLTRQLLAFARKQAVVPRVVDLNERVSGTLKMLHRLIGEDIDLRWKPCPSLWPVYVDPTHVDQILANLCVNARDAITDVGKVTIETGNTELDDGYCAAHAGFVPGPYVRLAVSDNGCGMDKDTLAHIFEPFFTTKPTGEGTGLGLATVYGAVKQNGGFVNAYSEPGRGTTFAVYLPRHRGPAREELAPPGDNAPSRGWETVLVVEDEKVILDVTTRVLVNWGYRVLAANSPEEALRLSHEHDGEIHLLLTDVIMPDMNGRDLAQRLVSLRPTLKPLFMSGYTANVIAHHRVLDADVHFIEKPFSPRKLAQKVRAVLGG